MSTAKQVVLFVLYFAVVFVILATVNWMVYG
jgi:hypothetical protein